MTTILASKIFDLISSKREGQYWDFKESHHENKADLLHDILCLSNSLHKGHKYLIIGVTDPPKGCKIIGVENDQNRRNQTNIIDFLRSKNFAGDIRPEIELKSLRFNQKIIDVLIIFDLPNKPYFLKEDYRDRDKVVRANHIYSRTLDTNTPIDSSADLRVIEQMWRERFLLDVTPSERMVAFLKSHNDWNRDIEPNRSSYHKYFPEFQVELGDVREFSDVYSFYYPNEKSYIGEARFKYFSTILFTLHYVMCDEMRITFAYPERSIVRTNGKSIKYMYYVLPNKNGAFLNFIRNGNLDFGSRGGDASFILFRDEDERMEFENYVISNLDKFLSLKDSVVGDATKQAIEDAGESFSFDPIELIKVKDFYQIWKLEVNS